LVGSVKRNAQSVKLGCVLRVDVFRSPFTTHYSLLAIRYSLPFADLPISRFADKFGSAGASPSHHSYALRFTHYAHILSVPFMA